MHIEAVQSSHVTQRICCAKQLEMSHEPIMTAAATAVALYQMKRIVGAALKAAGNPQERIILGRDCQSIIAEINEYFTAMGALRSSSRNNAVRDVITQYLTSKGTPTAFEMLREFEQRGWANV